MELSKNKWVNVVIFLALIIVGAMVALACSSLIKDGSGNTRLSPFGLGAVTPTPPAH